MDSKVALKKGLAFVEPSKVRKTKRGDLLIFVSEKIVITLNKNYVLKILNSQKQPE